MNTEFQHLDLVDILSERHYLLRKMTEKLWNDSSDIYLSNSECLFWPGCIKSSRLLRRLPSVLTFHGRQFISLSKA